MKENSRAELIAAFAAEHKYNFTEISSDRNCLLINILNLTPDALSQSSRSFRNKTRVEFY